MSPPPNPNDVLTFNAGGVPSYKPSGPPGTTFQTLTGLAAKGNPGPALVFNIDLSAFNEQTVILLATIIITTKSGGAALTGSDVGFANYVVNNKAGTVTPGAAAAGGAKNPQNTTDFSIPQWLSTCDGVLQSGGGAAVAGSWSAPGGAIARLTIVNSNAANDGDVAVYLTLIAKAA